VTSRPSAAAPAAAVTYVLLLLNLGAFLYELSQPTVDALRVLVESWGMVPREYALARDLTPAIPVPFWATLVTSTFLHGGWVHLGANMLYLWLLGYALERRLGHGRFLVVYLLCGAVAGLAHVAAHPSSMIPTVGASGGISGMVGGYLSLLPWRRQFPGAAPERMWIKLPALVLAALWIVNGVAELTLGWQADQVASWAHAGGFLIGLTVGAFQDALPSSPASSAVDCQLPTVDYIPA
jgi:membrane associated rhomboid family serine protease